MNRGLQEFRDQVDANYRDLVTRLEKLETNQRRTTEKNESQNNSRSSQRVRAQPYNTDDLDACLLYTSPSPRDS